MRARSRILAFLIFYNTLTLSSCSFCMLQLATLHMKLKYIVNRGRQDFRLNIPENPAEIYMSSKIGYKMPDFSI